MGLHTFDRFYLKEIIKILYSSKKNLLYMLLNLETSRQQIEGENTQY